MNLHANPKSSPGRPDDFPPPLMMRLPRTKSSKRATTRSRANSMFPRKINKGNETNLEPSSPKVTCIGQVRVKRDTTATTAAAVRRCRWFRRLWRRKFSFSRCDRCTKSEKLEEPKRIEANRNIKREVGAGGAGEDELVTESPPRNAFLLTRSKSAPYRSSSLANKILESKRSEEGGGDGTGTNAVEKNEETYGVDEEENRGDGGSINGVQIEGFDGKAVSVSRCKSVPATQADKLFTDCSS